MSWLELFLYPTLYVLFIWWASTGLIIRLTRFPWAYPAVFGGSILAAVVGGILLVSQRIHTDMPGLYLSFLGGILCWGWLETSYYTGYIVGPKPEPCREGCGGFAHFWHALRANLYHELCVVAAAIALVILEWGAANQVGLWTFLTLWWAHQVAKLNVFFGVRNLNVNFLPPHLKAMAQFFRERSMNYFFPISATASAVVATVLISKGIAAGDTFHKTALFVLGELVGLALLELWFLVVPLSSTLWDWSLAKEERDATKRLAVDLVSGFLGSGKTTTIRALLADPPPGERLVVLVNEFGQVGLDGARLAAEGAEVVELPNGCICCTMRGDLRSQVLRLAKQYSADRLVIEPSGVANAGELLIELHDPALAGVLGQVRSILVVDPARFVDSELSIRQFTRTQVRAADVVVLNRVDVTSDLLLAEVGAEIGLLAPHARMIRTSFGRLNWADLGVGHQVASDPSAAAATDNHSYASAVAQHTEQQHGAHPDFSAVSEEYGTDLPFELSALQSTLAQVQRGTYGPVWRAKGLVSCDDGWWQFDATREQVVWQHARAGAASKITLIGLGLRVDALRQALLACRAELVLAS